MIKIRGGHHIHYVNKERARLTNSLELLSDVRAALNMNLITAPIDAREHGMKP